MILAALIGLALERWGSVPDAAIHGVLIGMLVALFVPPGNRSCRIR